jgi:dsDNA-specific endonuclease/ATPase MutS2
MLRKCEKKLFRGRWQKVSRAKEVSNIQKLDLTLNPQVLHGVTGESHALSIAKRMGLGDDVLQRAEELMGAQVC